MPFNVPRTDLDIKTLIQLVMSNSVMSKTRINLSINLKQLKLYYTLSKKIYHKKSKLASLLMGLTLVFYLI